MEAGGTGREGIERSVKCVLQLKDLCWNGCVCVTFKGALSIQIERLLDRRRKPCWRSVHMMMLFVCLPRSVVVVLMGIDNLNPPTEKVRAGGVCMRSRSERPGASKTHTRRGHEY